MKPKGNKQIFSVSYTQGVKEEMHWIPIKELGKYRSFPKFLNDYLSREYYGNENIV